MGEGVDVHIAGPHLEQCRQRGRYPLAVGCGVVDGVGGEHLVEFRPAALVDEVAVKAQQLVNGHAIGGVNGHTSRGASREQMVCTWRTTISSGIPAMDAHRYTVSTGASAAALLMCWATSSGGPW